jgi:hypothetical protein
MKDASFDGVSGLKMSFRMWQPDTQARGVVAIVPGFKSAKASRIKCRRLTLRWRC